MADPSTIFGANLVGWFNAPATTCYSDAGTTLCSAGGDGTGVYQWNDQSGNSYHMVQATSGNRPKYRTFGPAVSWDYTGAYDSGAGINLGLSSSLSLNRQTMAMFMVAEFCQHSGQKILFNQGSNALWLQYYNGQIGANFDATNITPLNRVLSPDTGKVWLGINSSSTSLDLWLQGTKGSWPVGPGSATATGGKLGGLATTNSIFGNIYEVVIVNTTATPTNITDLATYFNATYSGMSMTESGRVLCVGDSIIQGFGSTGCRGAPYRLKALLPANTLVYNCGISGAKAILSSSNAASLALNWMFSGGGVSENFLPHHRHGNPSSTTALRSAAVVMIGTNDCYGGLTAASTEAGVQGICQLLKSSGFYVLVCSILPSGLLSGATETARQNVNTWISANYATFADAYLDAASVTHLTDPSNVTYFADGLHLTDTGYGVLAAALATPLNSFFTASSGGGLLRQSGMNG